MLEFYTESTSSEDEEEASNVRYINYYCNVVINITDKLLENNIK